VEILPSALAVGTLLLNAVLAVKLSGIVEGEKTRLDHHAALYKFYSGSLHFFTESARSGVGAATNRFATQLWRPQSTWVRMDKFQIILAHRVSFKLFYLLGMRKKKHKQNEKHQQEII